MEYFNIGIRRMNDYIIINNLNESIAVADLVKYY